MANDFELLTSTMRSNLNFLRSNWRMLGRPVLIIVVHQYHLENDKVPGAMISTIKKLKSGYINGTRVSLSYLEDFLSTSCITNLSFLGNQEEGDPDTLNASVKEYLERELNKTFSRTKFTSVSGIAGKRRISIRSRRSGVSGIIKRTRSIQIDNYDPELTRLRANYERENVHDFSPASPTVEFAEGGQSPPYEEEEEAWESNLANNRSRTMSELQFDKGVTGEDLITMFKETEILEEQGDILHYLVVTKGVQWDTGLGTPDNPIKVRDLLKVTYEKACHEKKWSLVRHIAGMLGKRVEDLTKAVADLLVRQKQITVGMPPMNEFTITRPLPSKELRNIIQKAHDCDQSTAMLTQELLVYLAMFIRTEPQLFLEMLRLRVGLIIQVMASELGRSLKCSGEEASEHLLNLSPFEMKTLLHHILSGKEFAVKSARSGIISLAHTKASKKSAVDNFVGKDTQDETGTESDRHGQWLRRRRLDGALNRVPRNFYPQIWRVLEKCQGLSVEGKVLGQQLTGEMTPGELKFALQVEQVLNSIPQPEYRQLMVEALMVLTLIVEHNAVQCLGGIINVEHLVHKANQIFLDDQRKADGDSTLCCASKELERISPCGGAAGICQHFYDSAPSGCYGTMTYMIRSVASTLNCFPKDEVDCTIS